MNDKSTINILIVDDDIVTRFIHKNVVESLTDFKITYSEAINGYEALVMVKNLLDEGHKLPDIILLDIDMPILNGFEFIEEFQKLDGNTKGDTEIIIVSSSDNPQDIVRSHSLGITNFLTKPVSKSTLQNVIIEQLGVVVYIITDE